MMFFIRSLTVRSLAALAALSVPLPAFAQDSAPVRHIRGTIAQVAPNRLTVETSRGPVNVAIDAKTKVLSVVPTSADEITSGSFIGTANVPGTSAAAARALEVVVFPPSMAGTGEGDRPWDLPAGKGHSSMTNGTVAAHRGGSRMTNGTVMGVNNRASKIITLQYKGGSKMVTIPPGTPIVRIEPGSARMLAAGAHVFITPGAGDTASPFVVVGEGGAVPPM